MKRILIAILFIMFFNVNFIFSKDKEDFNSYLLLNKNFFSLDNSNYFDYQKSFINKLKGIEFKTNSNYGLKFKAKNTNVSIKLNKIDDENIDLKIHEKDYIDLKTFSFNIKQFWKYNVSTSIAYFFRKYSNFKLLDTDFEEKGYSINISKVINSNTFSLSYENIDLSADKTYEDIFIENGEKNKLTLSYQINLNKKFSIIFLYSLTKFEKSNDQENEDLFFTGFKYKFDFFKNLE